MPFALVVEDGTIKAGANSYVALDDVRTFASARGLTVSSDDTALTASIMKAMDYVNSFDARWIGRQMSPTTQALGWPRQNSQWSSGFYDGIAGCYGPQVSPYLAPNVIPQKLKDAVSQVACIVESGVDIMPTQTGLVVIQETVGPLTTKYSEILGTPGAPFMPTVDALLKPLLSGSTGLLTNIRI